MLSDIQLQNTLLTALRVKGQKYLYRLGTHGLTPTLLPHSTTAFSKTPVRQKIITTRKGKPLTGVGPVSGKVKAQAHNLLSVITHLLAQENTNGETRPHRQAASII